MLAVGDSVTLTFSAHVDGVGDADNVASVSTNEGAEDTDTAHVICPHDPGIDVEKQVWDESSSSWVDEIRVPVGTDLFFNITVTNTGNCNLSNVIVTDTLASQLEYRDDSNYPEHSVSSDLREVVWHFDLLTPGETIEITFHAETVHTCYGWNEVNVSGYCDVNAETAYDEELLPIKVFPGDQPVVDITKRVWHAGRSSWVDYISTTFRRNLTFKIIINCTALTSVNNVVVIDNLPDLLEYRGAASIPPSSYSLHKVTWNLGSMEPGEVIEITYHAVTVREGFGSNVATVSTLEHHYDEDSVLVEVADFPVVQLIYPTGGEVLSGTVSVRWFALDSDLLDELPIYLYYSADGGDTWRQINDVLYNNIDETRGEYQWSTTDLSDGEYMLMVEAVNIYNAIAHDKSDVFTINNGIATVRVSDVRITDVSIDSSKWVKDGDTVEITAGITGGHGLNQNDIVADLTGFGKGANVAANRFDGFTAQWLLTSVKCSPSDGLVTVTVTADGIHSKSATITADNTKPKISIDKPENGLYLFNRKILPLPKTIIIGPIFVEVDTYDSSGIGRVEFYVDGELMETVTEEPYEWYMREKIKGHLKLKVIVYDHAENIAMQSREILKLF
jgi:uncharacterized repeat protein (TIGR01451 family)